MVELYRTTVAIVLKAVLAVFYLSHRVPDLGINSDGGESVQIRATGVRTAKGRRWRSGFALHHCLHCHLNFYKRWIIRNFGISLSCGSWPSDRNGMLHGCVPITSLSPRKAFTLAVRLFTDLWGTDFLFLCRDGLETCRGFFLTTGTIFLFMDSTVGVSILAPSAFSWGSKE